MSLSRLSSKPSFRRLLAGALLGGLLLLPAAGVAQDIPGNPLVAKYPALVDFEKQGGIVEYLGSRGSLEGFALITQERDLKTVYVTPEGSMVMGILVDEKGANLTAAQLQAYQKRLDGDQSAVPGAEQSGLSKSEQVYAAAEKANWVRVGDEKAPYAYVFMNVNCPHCQAMFKDVQPAVAAGQLQLRLIPYGAAPANRDGGAALLTAKDPGAAWLAYINGDAAALDDAALPADAVQKLDANTAMVGRYKIKGPPFTLYRRPSDAAITGIVGRPSNTIALVSDLMPIAPAAETETEDAAP